MYFDSPALFSCFTDTGSMRTWVVGDSLIGQAGSTNAQLAGGGAVTWKGVGGSRFFGLISRVLRYHSLLGNTWPTTIILHVGILHVTNACFIRHSHIFNPLNDALFSADGLHLSDDGKVALQRSLSDALVFFNANPGSVSYPPLG